MAEQLLERARAEGVSLVGPGGLLSGVTKTVLETALDAELTDHLGYEPHERVGADNSRNGYRAKTVLTDVGPVEVNVPRDRAGSSSRGWSASGSVASSGSMTWSSRWWPRA